VSAVQHAALSHVVTSESRVFACGDGLKGIYLWRHADPRWFAAATTEGTYLGVDWDTHENRTATTTYRCVPDIAAGINAIAEPVFSDPARGNLGDLDASYPRLDAARDGGEGGDGAAVHVSSFAGIGHPGSAMWADPDGELGEANMLATHISRGSPTEPSATTTATRSASRCCSAAGRGCPSTRRRSPRKASGSALRPTRCSTAPPSRRRSPLASG